MMKNSRMRMDIMNRNTITSLAMLYALWQSNRQDLLDLIRPFVLYAVGDTTSVNSEIDITAICNYMEKEFGYKSIQTAVINRVLLRESSSRVQKEHRYIERKNNQFFLIKTLSQQTNNFAEKRIICKAHSDSVTDALTSFLNEKRVHNRTNYTQPETEKLLLTFFEGQGDAIVLSVDNLRQLKARSNELDFFIAQFILTEYERKSVLFDYLMELVKGYFVTAALYLQAENPNATTASFSDVTFFLDTRLLLAYLGYKTEEENKSVQKMVASLKKNGAKLACFTYNIDEVYNILEAYKLSTVSKSKRSGTFTLEYFDANGYSSTHVERYQRTFTRSLNSAGIRCVTPSDLFSNTTFDGVLDESKIAEIILSNRPNYNQTSLSDDLSAINAISRMRKGKRYPYIEKCKAVFVTYNSVLVSAIREYTKESECDFGFPIAITGDDLCVMAWLKDFEQSNDLPQMRLLENVLAAITPSKELMDAYFSHLEDLERQGGIESDEVALLRVDLFAKKELMNLTFGDSENLSSDVINKIRYKMREESLLQGRNEAQKQYEREKQQRKNDACKRAEDEVNEIFRRKEKRGIRTIEILSAIIAVCFIAASLYCFVSQSNNHGKFIILFFTIITTIEGVIPFFSKSNFVIKCYKRCLQKRMLQELDAKKDEYLSILGE